MEGRFPDSEYCPFFQRTLELVGRRWTASILRCLFLGEQRFSDIKNAIPGISARLLTVRLNELIDAGLVEGLPGERGGYRLSDRGEDLRHVFVALEAWNERWIPGKR